MAKFVPDVKTDRWVVIAPARVVRPHDNTPFKDKGVCPFCPGQEAANRELFRLDGPEGGWGVRVIENKYPITDWHEVIIHSPDHNKDIDELPLSQTELILSTYRQRFNYHVSAGHGTVLIFNNHDVHAGASISHPHSQVVVVPRQINLDTIAREPVQNEAARTENFVAYCPDFSQWPYELWIAPKDGGKKKEGGQGKNFGEITDGEIADLAGLLQRALRFVVTKFSAVGAMHQNVLTADETGDIPYNYYIYHGEDWYLRIIPRLVHRAGFELGTGLSVNIVDPVEAAREYQQGLQAPQ